MRTLGLILILIMLMATASAIVIEELDPDIPIVVDPESGLNQERDLQILQRMASLENKFNNVATKEDVTAAVTFTVNTLSQDFENKTDFMVIAILFGFIFILAILITGYFILKSRRRI